ncbi:MAG TPA: cellulase family glycosylhydrolase [Phycisphaerae bacterium]|nr:cellulase family glycosylhydrolase [Phycisphaerae bacterium]HQE28914.1 cellulase family glycosylhydrolase [Phycisphaerae bacterium]
MSGAQPVVDFVRRSGWQFVARGRPIRFAGTNCYCQMIHRRTGHTGADDVLDAMAARGMNLLRTWAFQDCAERPGDCLLGAPAERLPAGKEPVDYVCEETLVALDRTIAAAAARGIYVVLTLVNNWDDFGGMNRWTLWRFGRGDHDAFFTDPTIRCWYKSLANLLVGRVNTVTGRAYRDEPAILTWQLANEARLARGGADGTAIDAWIAEMAEHIKGIDPNHMVSTGIEGFYGGSHADRNPDGWMGRCGTDFIDNHRHDAIDFATCHVWPQNWGWDPIGRPAAAMQKASRFVLCRIYDAQDALGKPLLLEEFGIPRDNAGRGPGGPTTIRDRFFAEAFLGPGEDSARNDGAFGGSAVWSIFDDATADWDDGNGIFLPQDASTDALLTAHARRMTQGSAPPVA